MLKNLFGFVLFAAAICACTSTKKVKTEKMTQGIAGIVVAISGNQMPMKGEEPPKPKGLLAEVIVHEKTNISQAIKDAKTGLFTTIITPKVTSIVTDSLGNFSIALPVGSYSLFIKMPNGYFANLFNEKNDIQVVTVDSCKISSTTIRVNQNAVY